MFIKKMLPVFKWKFMLKISVLIIGKCFLSEI